eukprot:scaffold57561_cov32-Tisochrysis_lutea.AAC.1
MLVLCTVALALQSVSVSNSWSSLGLNDALTKCVTSGLNLRGPLEVQQLAWPVISSGCDAVVVSEAGSGKTLAYLLPILQLLLDPPDPSRASRAVIAVPSTDLASQVLGVAQQLTEGTSLVASAPTTSGSDVIVGTIPECLAYVCQPKGKKRAADSSSTLTRLVVDEADILLAGLRKKGRASTGQPVMKILGEVKHARKQAEKAISKRNLSVKKTAEALDRERIFQLILVSATVPSQGDASVGALVNELFPSIKWIRSSGAHRPVPQLTSSFITVAGDEERQDELIKLVRNPSNRTLVFANSAARANHVAKFLRAEGLTVGIYQPELSPGHRAAAVEIFNRTPKGVLVCSGLAARGLDFSPVGLVVQYQLAPHMVEYMHRVGRTARAGRPGAAVALVTEHSAPEIALMQEVQRCIRGSWKYV